MRHRAGLQPLRDLDSEAVVAQEDVADPGHEHAAVHDAPVAAAAGVAERLDLIGMEEQVATVGEQGLGRGIVIDGDRYVELTVDIVEHARDRGVMPSKNMSWASARRDGRNRTDVPVQTSTPARRPCRSTGRPRRRPRVPTTATVIAQEARLRQSWRRSYATHASSRGDVPKLPVASRRCDPRSRRRGDRSPRASAFSSSVRVSTRRARISSISVAS